MALSYHASMDAWAFRTLPSAVSSTERSARRT
jgi:hypothetical protein